MSIEVIYIGAESKTCRYFIVNDKDCRIAGFDSFEKAACVLRYLTGAAMTQEDSEAAHAAMREFDNRKKGGAA